MSTPGILAILKTTPDRADQVAAFLTSAREAAVAEEGTVTWYAWQADETTFGVFDTFTGEDGRQAHLSGEIATKLGEVAGELLDGAPDIRMIDILAAK